MSRPTASGRARRRARGAAGRGQRRWALVAVAAVTLLMAIGVGPGGSVAHAQPAAARGLQKGQRYFDRGNFRQARRTLARALKGAKEPDLLKDIHLYLGLCHAVRGDMEETRENFTQALWHDPELALDPEVFKPSLVEMFAEIKGGLRGKLVVGTSSPGAKVLLDGEELGPAPLEQAVPVGRHTLQVVTSDGLARSAEEIIRIQPGEKLRIDPPLRAVTGRVDLESAPSGAVVSVDGKPTAQTPERVDLPVGRHLLRVTLEGHQDWSLELDVAEGETLTVRAELEVVPPPPPPQTSPWLRPYRLGALTAGALAVVAAGVGAGMGLGAASDQNEFQDGGQGSDPSENLTYDQAEDLRSSARSKALGANISWGAAGALAAAAGALLYLDLRDADDPDEPAPAKGTAQEGTAAVEPSSGDGDATETAPTAPPPADERPAAAPGPDAHLQLVPLEQGALLQGVLRW